MSEEESGKTFEFDLEFQTRILAYMLRDHEYNLRTEGLVQPSYFDSEAHSALASIAVSFFQAFKSIPSLASLTHFIKKARDAKKIKDALLPDIKELLKTIYQEELSDRSFVIEEVVNFAKRQALTEAIMKSIAMLDKGEFAKIEETIKSAVMVGQNDEAESYNFFEEIDNRLEYRKELFAGTIKPDGISTGFPKLDERLYHRGWGRKELSVIMGPAKAGKSMSLVSFGAKACMAGYNVLYVSLEVATKIIADRFDANISQTNLGELITKMARAKNATDLAKIKAGQLRMHDFASGSFTPSQLRRLLHRYDSKGIRFDLVIVDYADIMAPDVMSSEPRENSRTIYLGLRAVAHEFNCAVLSATQTNREGFKAAVGKMEHIADDINKARTVDLLISINASEDERARGEARLYLAASRNQQGDVTFRVKNNNAQARFIEEILEVL